MGEPQTTNQEPLSEEEKQKAFLERARKGLLQHLKERGGDIPLSDLHEFSLNKFFIQHQSFSRLMETLVDQGLVDFDSDTYSATITELGKSYTTG